MKHLLTILAILALTFLPESLASAQINSSIGTSGGLCWEDGSGTVTCWDVANNSSLGGFSYGVGGGSLDAFENLFFASNPDTTPMVQIRDMNDNTSCEVEGSGRGRATASHIYVAHYYQDKLVKIPRGVLNPTNCSSPTDIPLGIDKPARIIKIGNILYVLMQGSLTTDPSIIEVDTANNDAVSLPHYFSAVYTNDVKDMAYVQSLDSFIISHDGGLWAVNRSTWARTDFGDIANPTGQVLYLDGYLATHYLLGNPGYIIDPSDPNNETNATITFGLGAALGYSSAGLSAFFLDTTGLRVFDLTGTELGISPLTTNADQMVNVEPWTAGPVCPNGTKETGEQCDGLDFGTTTCQTEGWDDGVLACTGTCTLDTSGCYDYVCTNGVQEGTEECDGSDFGSATCVTEGFVGGSLSCTGACIIDTTNCHDCGNASIDAGEQCDGAELGGQTCVGLGFDSGPLGCTSSCGFDTSSCVTDTCDNGTLDPGEDCDGTNLNNATCVTEGFAGGTLACQPGSCAFDTSSCTMCGNATIDGTEQCDSANMNGGTCENQGFDGGTLSCDNSCSFNTSGCTMNTCGNGEINPGEECDDGSTLNSDGCSSNCQIEDGYECNGAPSVCTPLCGNNTLDDGTEQCDGNDFGNATCSDFGHNQGNLACNSNCTIDTSQCLACNQDGLVTLVGDVLDRSKLNNHNLDLYEAHLEILNTNESSFSCETVSMGGQEVSTISVSVPAGSYENVRIKIGDKEVMAQLFAETMDTVFHINVNDPKKIKYPVQAGSGVIFTEDGANLETYVQGALLAALGTGASYRVVDQIPGTSFTGNFLELYVSDATVRVLEWANSDNNVVIGLPEMWNGALYINLDAMGDLKEILNRKPVTPPKVCGCNNTGNGAPAWPAFIPVVLFMMWRRRRTATLGPPPSRINPRKSR